MKRMAALVGILLLCPAALTADDKPKRTPKEALRAFDELIGAWRATGIPEKKADKQKGAWDEKLAWEWQFKDKDVWLKCVFDKGKHFTEGQLRYLPEKDAFRFDVVTVGKDTLRFEGKLKEHLLTLDREDEAKQESQRIVISLLHNNRYLYHYETKPSAKTLYTKVYQVGCTKEGVPFAVKPGEDGPECIVSGGPGTMAVTHKGKTYYVCCGGCRSEFLADPEKFIKEFEEAQAKKAKEKSK